MLVAVDVVAVSGAGRLRCTDWWVRCGGGGGGGAGAAARALLGLNDGASPRQGSEAFLSGPAPASLGGGFKSGSVTPNRSADDLTMQADIMHGQHLAAGGLFSEVPEVAWVDFFCNGARCEDVVAYVEAATNMVVFKQGEEEEGGGGGAAAAAAPLPTPSEAVLQRLGLRPGKNSFTARHRRLGYEATFSVWLFGLHERLVVMDIDGTITRSDVRGYFESVYLGVYTYVHDGVVPLLHALRESFGYHVLYLTSRPVAHQRETRQLLAGVRERNLELPEGPLFMNKESTSKAVFRELITRTTLELKSGLLREVRQVFWAAGAGGGGGAGSGVDSDQQQPTQPFVWGIGNKPADCEAYYSVGVPEGSILLIDTASDIRVWSRAAAGHTSSSSSSAGRGSAADESQNARSVEMTTVRGGVFSAADPKKSDEGPGPRDSAQVPFRSYRDPRLLEYMRGVSGVANAELSSAAFRPAVQSMEGRFVLG